MDQFALKLSLKFEGGTADRSEMNLYDVAQSLVGFQRSLALTTHLVLNDEVITQAPALKRATIYAAPPQAGSWEIYAIVTSIIGVIGTAAVAPKDSVVGHLIASAYDYVIKESLGFHVDFQKLLVNSMRS